MLKKLMIPSLSLATVLIGMNSALAQSSTSMSASTQATAPTSQSSASGVNLSKIPLSTVDTSPQKAKAFSMVLGLERGSNLAAEGSALDKTTTTLLLNPKLNLSQSLSLSARTFVERQENGSANNTEASDTQISLALKGQKWGESLQPTYSMNGFAPTSDSNHKETRFQGAAGAGFKIAGSYTFADAFYSVSYRRNFHEYTVSASGTSNIRETVAQAAGLDIPLSQKWSISLAGGYRNAWTYQNSSRQSFSTDADINFEAVKDLTFNIGASNEGSALKANGKDSNISFYDDKSSVIRLGVSYVL